MHVILEEDRTGLRNTNFAVRVWPEATGKPVEQLGLAAADDPLSVGDAAADRRIDRLDEP